MRNEKTRAGIERPEEKKEKTRLFHLLYCPPVLLPGPIPRPDPTTAPRTQLPQDLLRLLVSFPPSEPSSWDLSKMSRVLPPLPGPRPPIPRASLLKSQEYAEEPTACLSPECLCVAPACLGHAPCVRHACPCVPVRPPACLAHAPCVPHTRQG